MHQLPFFDAMLPLVMGGLPSSEPSSRQSTAERSAAPSEPVMTPTQRQSYSPSVYEQRDRATQVPAPAQSADGQTAQPREAEPRPVQQQEAYEIVSDTDSDATRPDVEVQPPPVAPEDEEQVEEDDDATQPDIHRSNSNSVSTHPTQQPILTEPTAPAPPAPTASTLPPHEHGGPDSDELPAPKRQRTTTNDADTQLDLHTVNAILGSTGRPLIATGFQAQRMPALTNTSTCPICMEVPRNAVATPCGHMLCGECLFKSVRSDAVHRQQEKEQTDRMEVARAVLWMRPPDVLPPEPTEAGQGDERIFLSAAQLVEVLDGALCNATKDQLQSYIERNRNASCQTIGWIQFVNMLVETAMSIQRRHATNGTTPTIRASNGTIRRYLNTTESGRLSALMVGQRDPQLLAEHALVLIRQELSVHPPRTSREVHESFDPKRTYEVFWFALRGSTGAGHLFGDMMRAHDLSVVLSKCVTGLPAQTPIPGRLPSIPIHRSFHVVREVVEYARHNAVLIVLERRSPHAAVYEALDRLSATLWAALDEHTNRGWTYAEFFAQGQRQRARVLGQPPPTLQGQRRTEVSKEEIDPMQGSCPICRSAIPGGFFAGIKHGGVQGLKFKVAKPVNELELR